MNDNFGNLWGRFREALIERRKPERVHTCNHLPFAPYEGTISTSAVDRDESRNEFVVLTAIISGAMVTMEANREDLLNIAEHCILRAAQFENQ